MVEKLVQDFFFLKRMVNCCQAFQTAVEHTENGRKYRWPRSYRRCGRRRRPGSAGVGRLVGLGAARRHLIREGSGNATYNHAVSSARRRVEPQPKCGVEPMQDPAAQPKRQIAGGLCDDHLFGTGRHRTNAGLAARPKRWSAGGLDSDDHLFGSGRRRTDSGPTGADVRVVGLAEERRPSKTHRVVSTETKRRHPSDDQHCLARLQSIALVG